MRRGWGKGRELQLGERADRQGSERWRDQSVGVEGTQWDRGQGLDGGGRRHDKT